MNKGKFEEPLPPSNPDKDIREIIDQSQFYVPRKLGASQVEEIEKPEADPASKENLLSSFKQALEDFEDERQDIRIREMAVALDFIKRLIEEDVYIVILVDSQPMSKIAKEFLRKHGVDSPKIRIAGNVPEHIKKGEVGITFPDFTVK
ncbi:MAG: hypothetical protein NTV48_00620 [Candidatus Vogelbacteria bacterium]|nr:hypothetical protein [Candidatus Vogelbacteria bacterium]